FFPLMPGPPLTSSSASSTPSRVSVPNVESGPESERYAPMTIASSLFPLQPPQATEVTLSARRAPMTVRRANMERGDSMGSDGSEPPGRPRIPHPREKRDASGSTPRRDAVGHEPHAQSAPRALRGSAAGS